MKRIKLYFLLTITLILISVSLATTLQFFKGYVIDGLASLNNQNNYYERFVYFMYNDCSRGIIYSIGGL